MEVAVPAPATVGSPGIGGPKNESVEPHTTLGDRLTVQNLAGEVLFSGSRESVAELSVADVKLRLRESGMDADNAKLIAGTKVLQDDQLLAELWPDGASVSSEPMVLQCVLGPRRPGHLRRSPVLTSYPRITSVSIDADGSVTIHFEEAAVRHSFGAVMQYQAEVQSIALSQARVSAPHAHSPIQMGGLDTHYVYMVDLGTTAVFPDGEIGDHHQEDSIEPRRWRVLPLTRWGWFRRWSLQAFLCALDLADLLFGTWASFGAIPSRPVAAIVLLATLWLPFVIYASWTSWMWMGRKLIGPGAVIAPCVLAFLCLGGVEIFIPLYLLLVVLTRPLDLAAGLIQPLQEQRPRYDGFPCWVRKPVIGLHSMDASSYAEYELIMVHVRILGDLPRLVFLLALSEGVSGFSWVELASLVVSAASLFLHIPLRHRVLKDNAWPYFDEVIMEVLWR